MRFLAPALSFQPMQTREAVGVAQRVVSAAFVGDLDWTASSGFGLAQSTIASIWRVI